jgi:hypothetical protein
MAVSVYGLIGGFACGWVFFDCWTTNKIKLIHIVLTTLFLPVMIVCFPICIICMYALKKKL